MNNKSGEIADPIAHFIPTIVLLLKSSTSIAFTICVEFRVPKKFRVGLLQDDERHLYSLYVNRTVYDSFLSIHVVISKPNNDTQAVLG